MFRTLIRDPFVASALLLVLGVCLAYATPWPGLAGARWWAENAAEPVFLAIVLATLAGTPAPAGHREERWFWRMLLVAHALWLAGALLLQIHSSWVPAKLVFLLSYLALALGADLRPHLPARWTSRVSEFGVGVAATLLTAAVLVLYFFVVPAAQGRVPSPSLARISFLALDVLLSLRFLHLALRSRSAAWAPIYALLSIACVLDALTDGLTLAILANRLSIPYGTPLDALWWMPFVGVIAARRLRHARAGEQADPAVFAPDDARTEIGELLLLSAFALPAMHVALAATRQLDQPEEPLRSAIVLGALLGFLVLAGGLHHHLQRRHHRLSSEIRVLTTNEKLLEAQKLEAIGRMAGGLAHDFSNLLMVVTGRAEMLRERLAGDPVARGDLAEIERVARDGAALTRQLLSFSRSRPVKAAPLDLGRCANEAQGLLQRLAGERVRFDVRTSPGLPLVDAEPSQVLQVLMNLVANSRDAMPDGGTISIETRELRIEQGGSCFLPPCPPGSFVALEVRDTGVGIAPEHRRHMFEPFYTTKTSGTGLGLAVVYAIVTNASGHVRVDSAPTRGTTITLVFPPSRGRLTSDPVNVRERSPAVPSARRVLLVEDQDPVRTTIRSMLERLGHEVVEAASGLEALRRSRELPAPPEILLVDVLMPDMRGPQVAASVRERHPDVRVIYMSGYVEGSTDLDLSLEPRSEVLAKPFSLRALRECLEDSAALVSRATGSSEERR